MKALVDCASVLFSGHALRRMFERRIGRADVLEVLQEGEIIGQYPEDKPYPSFLLLGFRKDEPLHVVAAREPEQESCFVVTAYRPDPAIWSDDYRTRRRP